MILPTDCVDPAVGESLMESAAREPPSLSSDQENHLNVCEACRTSVNRLHRLGRTWRTLEPTPAELAMAVRRLRPRPSRPATRRAVWGVAAAVLVFAAVASASLQIATRAGPHAATQPAPATITVRSSPSPPEVDVVVQVPTPSATSALSVGDPTPTALAPGRPPRASVRAAIASVPSRAPMPPAATSGALPAPDAWADAAAAIRNRDYARAERDFDGLVAAPDAATRESARLARAQILLVEGRRSEAREEFAELAGTAANAFVRQQAAAELARTR